MATRNQYTLPFWTATLTVSTAATSLFTLATAYFTAARPTEAIDSSATCLFLTAELGNGATVIYVGDKTLNGSTTPPGGVGWELVAGQSAANGGNMTGGATTDLNNYYVQASTTVTPYLCVMACRY